MVHAGPELEHHVEAAGAAYAPSTEDDFRTEWYSLDLSVRTVPDLDAALDHIRTFGTKHTEVIVTEDRAAARRFTAEVDAAVVIVNASSRFTDGARVRVRRGDRHLHPEAARARPDGPDRADDDQVGRRGRRPGPG